jgi:hypothetical protein
MHHQGSSSNAANLFIPSLNNPAKNCGYIVFKDSKIVLFYTNDLVEDPPEPVLLGSDERAVKCVHGLAKLSHWTGTEVVNRSDFFVAVPIVMYNMFMNGVDRMDQYHSTLPTQRKELRLHMTTFRFLLDLAVSQAYAIHQKCSEDDRTSHMTFFNFKQKVCELLVTPFMSSSKAHRDQRDSNTPSPSENNESNNNNNTNTIESHR